MWNQLAELKRLIQASFIALLVMMFLSCILLSKMSSNLNSDQAEDQKKYEKALEGKLTQFTTIPAKTQLVKEPYINGKIAFIRKLEKPGI